MIKFVINKKDIECLYNQYLTNNNGNISETLKSLERYEKLPISFIRYFETDEDFRKHFNIDEESYFKNCSFKWRDEHIFSIK